MLPFHVRARRALNFTGRVLAGFRRHKGFLLAGGLAYNLLISLIPLLAVLLVAVSTLFEPAQILAIVHAELTLILPGGVAAVVREVEGFLQHREMIGGIGLLVLLFFASLAFRMLEDALAVIFEHRRIGGRRRFWISALLPYFHILILGTALIALTGVVTLLDAIANRGVTFIGLPISDLTTVLLYVAGLVGHVLLFALIYWLMPTIKIQFRRALIGGLIATILWELIRLLLTWYFTNLSMISVIYGSLATGMIVLFSFEIAAVILLLGAQAIAELQHSADAGLPWYEPAPDELPSGTAIKLPVPTDTEDPGAAGADAGGLPGRRSGPAAKLIGDNC